MNLRYVVCVDTLDIWPTSVRPPCWGRELSLKFSRFASYFALKVEYLQDQSSFGNSDKIRWNCIYCCPIPELVSLIASESSFCIIDFRTYTKKKGIYKHRFASCVLVSLSVLKFVVQFHSAYRWMITSFWYLPNVVWRKQHLGWVWWPDWNSHSERFGAYWMEWPFISQMVCKDVPHSISPN